MTAYNREKYIAEAIESVINSTYQNWELIIVDDCSHDRTVEIARKFEKQDDRIKVYVNEKNLGDYPNRNRAASYAKGKYLKYVDADDLIYPYGLEQLVFYMEQFPDAGYGLCSLEQDKHKIFPFLLSPVEAYRRHYFGSPLFHKSPLSAIIRRDIFEKVGGFTGKNMVGDFEMWHLLSQRFQVVLMPIGLVWYREHDSQETSKYRSDPFVPFKYLLCQRDLIIDQKCPLNVTEKKVCLKKIEIRISKSVLSSFRRSSFKKGVQLYSNSGQRLIYILYNGLFNKW
jgi:glycosyltransferase involved in cell wall biosynthesis